MEHVNRHFKIEFKTCDFNTFCGLIASNIIAWIWSFQLNMDMIKRRWRRLFEEVQLEWDCEMVILRIDRNKLPQTTDRDADYCIIIVDWFETEMEIMTVRSDVKMIIQR